LVLSFECLAVSADPGIALNHRCPLYDGHPLKAETSYIAVLCMTSEQRKCLLTADFRVAQMF
jgi:hypothetical protein